MQKFEMNKADFREHPHLTRLSDVMTFSANKEEGSKVESLRNGQQMAETPEDAIGGSDSLKMMNYRHFIIFMKVFFEKWYNT